LTILIIGEVFTLMKAQISNHHSDEVNKFYPSTGLRNFERATEHRVYLLLAIAVLK